MSAEAPLVDCAEHGMRPAAYVCAHSLASLDDERPRGLLWSRDEKGLFNGYCDACDRHLERHGGEWTEETVTYANVKLVCEACFRRIAALNGIGALG